MTLIETWEKLKAQGVESDKNSIHSYLPVYEKLFAPFQNETINVLEVGIFKGDSLKMWKEYFSPSSEIYGIDCDTMPHGGLGDLRRMITEGYNIAIGDATNTEDISKFYEGKKFKIIIEDAGHDVSQQLQIYNTLKFYLDKDPIYIIEDVQDIDATRTLFENIDPEKEITILDRREIKGRYDDCLIIIKDKK